MTQLSTSRVLKASSPAMDTRTRWTSLLVIGALLAAVGITGLLGRLSGTSPGEPHGVDPSGTAAGAGAGEADGSLAVPGRTPFSSDGEGPHGGDRPTVGERLAEYWGRNWPQVKAIAEERGLDLDSHLEFPPWSEVASEVREHFQMDDEERGGLVHHYVDWPEELDAEFLAELTSFEVELGADVVEMVEGLVEPHNLAIREQAEVLVEMIATAKADCWNYGTFSKAPLIPFHGERRRGEALYPLSAHGERHFRPPSPCLSGDQSFLKASGETPSSSSNRCCRSSSSGSNRWTNRPSSVLRRLRWSGSKSSKILRAVGAGHLRSSG